MGALDDQIIIPRQRQRRFLPSRPAPRLTRLHTFVLGALLGGCLVAAFSGAPRAPVPAALPDPAPSAPRAAPEPIADYGPPAPKTHTIEGTLRADEFISDVLTSAGASALEVDRAVEALDGIFDFRKARPGDRYRLELEDGAIRSFEYRSGPADIFEVERQDDRLVGRKRPVEVTKHVVEVRGSIDNSLYDAFLKAGESESLAMSFADAFRFDVDFFHETQKGDAFRIFVEKTENEEGQLIEYGKVLAAEYDGAVGTKRLYWFKDGFYDDKGTAAQRAFLRSPLAFTRISSGFGYRNHPIHGGRHFHGGVDYAAPLGTPVHAVGDGVVTFAANKGPNGNMVTIRHSGGLESYYLHLSKISVQRGEHVTQSTLIGKVGSTGNSTGPHLDFRIKKNGTYLDPSKQVTPRSKTIDRRDRAAFAQTVSAWRARLDAVAQLP